MQESRLKYSPLLVACLLLLQVGSSLKGQEASHSSVEVIIDKIATLESAKDPKCYATANRLEDFMYGTPLSEAARNLRIEVQKEISLYLRTVASDLARSKNRKQITNSEIVAIVDSMATVGKLKDGDFFWRTDSIILRMRKIDFDQYSSVAYGYRSLLSVEQDLMFMEDPKLLPLSDDAIDALNSFLNLATLASLSMADVIARERQLYEVSEEVMRASWIRILKRPQNQALFDFQYPKLASGEMGNTVLKEVIRQKIHSYDKYNELSTSIFLRNIQVFFARQKWPSDEKISAEMKNYFLESLIAFVKELIRESDDLKHQRNDALIRIVDVQKSLQTFLPFAVNRFEDVIYFPGDNEHEVTIESYDLDAFRDGGIHWRVLDYALQDSSIFNMVIDPTAAELVVEGVAQLGVLVLRLAGQISREEEKGVLTVEDLENGFKSIQTRINAYSPKASKDEDLSISSQPPISGHGEVSKFVEVTDRIGIEFHHRSADWLSRFIRSYVYSPAENTAKIAIPPAFGGSGIAAEDLNNDGLVDILLLGGQGNKLYLNDSSGIFSDISAYIPLNHWDEMKNSFAEPRQPLIADFNNDGLQDVLIIFVDEMHKMLRNLDGTHFEDVSTVANLDGREMVAGPATVFDYDNDGLLDVFIGYFGNYLQGVLPTLSRHNQNGMRNRLYRNLGEFKFEEVTFTADSLTDTGWTQAVGHTDINQDGRQDLIVGNDFGVNRYYLNTADGFIEKSKEWKTDKPSYTMNVGIGDLNRDQYPDLYISNIVVMQKEEKYVSPNKQTTMKFDPEKMKKIRTVEANDLFLSANKDGVFVRYELSDHIGRGFSSTGWSWDADFFDFDNDGDEDLYCLNGMNDFRVYSTENPFYYGADAEHQEVSYAESDRERNVFFVNEGGVLVNKATELSADLLSNSRSASYLDYDRDGDLDIVINNYHDKAVFLENRAGDENHWLKVKLIGDPSQGVNLDAIGSSIIIDPDSDQPQWREVHSTTGYLSVHPKEQHFGLGQDDDVAVRIKWSNGEVANLAQLQANRNYIIKYPDIIIN